MCLYWWAAHTNWTVGHCKNKDLHMFKLTVSILYKTSHQTVEIELFQTLQKCYRVFKIHICHGLQICIGDFRKLTYGKLYIIASSICQCWHVCVPYKCLSDTKPYWVVVTVPNVIQQVPLLPRSAPYQKFIFQVCILRRSVPFIFSSNKCP